MVNVVELQKVIDDSGISITAIAEKLNVNRGTVYNKLENPSSITVADIEGFTKVLRLSKVDRDRIFFAKDVRANRTNEEMNNAESNTKEETV